MKATVEIEINNFLKSIIDLLQERNYINNIYTDGIIDVSYKAIFNFHGDLITKISTELFKQLQNEKIIIPFTNTTNCTKYILNPTLKICGI